MHDPNLDKLELRKKVGMVFQQYNLFPHKTALENVMMAPLLVLKRQNKIEVEKRARALIKKVRLEGKEGIPIPASSPAGSSSALPSPGLWP